jgi:hypothetical protein
MTKSERDGLKKAVAYFVDEHEGGWEKGMEKLQALLRADAQRRKRLAGKKVQEEPEKTRETATLFPLQGVA